MEKERYMDLRVTKVLFYSPKGTTILKHYNPHSPKEYTKKTWGSMNLRWTL